MQIKFDANKKRLDTTPAFGLLVQGENLAESIQITGPKMVGALDLSQLRVAVRMTSAEYETTVEKTLEQTTDGDTITLIWEVDKQFTGSPGKVDVMLVGYGGNEEVIKITSSGMVVQEDKVFGTAPPESTWEQILQQMQDFATQAYESKTAAANSAAAAAASQKVAEEKAAQATNAANEAVKAAETAAADAAAQAAAKTEQQIRQYADDRYARALQGTADPAASITIYPDAGSNVAATVHGFTIQKGEGDPSTVNVREIVNGGRMLKKYVVTGEESRWAKNDGADNNGNYLYFLAGFGAAVGSECICNRLKYYSTTFQTTPSVGISPAGSLYMNIGAVGSSLASFKKALNDAYTSGNPYIVWYIPADGLGTELYATCGGSGNGFAGAVVGLTAPLCQGDKLITKVKSGCDKKIVVDGENVKVYDGGSTFFNVGIGSDNGASGTTVYKNYGGGVSNSGSNLKLNKADFGVYGDTPEAFNEHCKIEPLIMWYRSVNYAEESDKPISLEQHVRSRRVLNGVDETWTKAGDAGAYYCNLRGKPSGEIVSEYLPYANANETRGGKTGIGIGALGGIQLRLPNGEDPAEYLPENPLVIDYELPSAIIYAHEPVDFIANPGEDGTWVITGEANGKVSAVYNKNLTHTIAELQAALLAVSANLSM